MEINLELKTKDSLPSSLLSRDDGVLIIPEGYRYCHECELITPHNTINEKWRTIYECKICGDSTSDFMNNCPNCGWVEPEPDGPLSEYITLHNSGCHFNQSVDNDLRFVNWPEYIADEFYYSWMKPAPDKSRYILPRNRELYDKNKHLEKRWQEMRDMKCGCPTYKVYRDPYIINYSYRHYASMDCMNAVEWNYDIRCPICGEIFHISDSNC